MSDGQCEPPQATHKSLHKRKSSMTKGHIWSVSSSGIPFSSQQQGVGFPARNCNPQSQESHFAPAAVSQPPFTREERKDMLEKLRSQGNTVSDLVKTTDLRRNDVAGKNLSSENKVVNCTPLRNQMIRSCSNIPANSPFEDESRNATKKKITKEEDFSPSTMQIMNALTNDSLRGVWALEKVEKIMNRSYTKKDRCRELISSPLILLQLSLNQARTMIELRLFNEKDTVCQRCIINKQRSEVQSEPIWIMWLGPSEMDEMGNKDGETVPFRMFSSKPVQSCSYFSKNSGTELITEFTAIDGSHSLTRVFRLVEFNNFKTKENKRVLITDLTWRGYENSKETNKLHHSKVFVQLSQEHLMVVRELRSSFQHTTPWNDREGFLSGQEKQDESSKNCRFEVDNIDHILDGECRNYVCKILMLGDNDSAGPVLDRSVSLFGNKKSSPREDVSIDKLTFKYSNAPDTTTMTAHYAVYSFHPQNNRIPSFQLFISPNVIYILVLNLDDYVTSGNTSSHCHRMEEMIMQLRTIHKKKLAYVMVLIHNKLSEQAITSSTTSIRENYADASAYVSLDLSKNKNVDLIWRCVTEIAIETKRIGALFPIDYVSLEERLIDIRKERHPPLLSWEEFQLECNANGIRGKDCENAAKLLHNVGSIMFRESRSNEDSTIVYLSPQWVGKLFASVLSHSSTIIENRGKLYHSQLSTLWNSDDFPLSLHSVLLALLSQCEVLLPIRKVDNFVAATQIVDKLTVLYPIPLQRMTIVSNYRECALPEYILAHSEYSLVPLFFPETASKLMAYTDNANIRVFGRFYNFLVFPSYLVPRLILRVVTVAENSGLKLVDYYKFGLCIAKGENAATLFLDKEKNRIRIIGKGSEIHPYLCLIDVLDSLITEEQLSLKSVVAPSYKHLHHHYRWRKPSTVSVANMLVARSRGEDTVLVDLTSFSRLKIADMAPDVMLEGLSIPIVSFSDLNVTNRIGRGGFGDVFVGTLNGTTVAVKTLDLPVDDETLFVLSFTEFRKELYLQAGLNHECIVNVRAACNGPMAIIMDYLPHSDHLRP